MTMIDRTTASLAPELPQQRLSTSAIAIGAIAAIALWLLLSGHADRDAARLPIGSEGVRAAVSYGISGRTMRMAFDGLVTAFTIVYLLGGVALVSLARGAGQSRARWGGAALLVLGGALLNSGFGAPPIALPLIAIAALLGLGWLVYREGTQGRGVLLSLAVAVAGTAAVYALIAAVPALVPPDSEMWQAAFRSPLILLPWMPVPFALAHGVLRGGLWGLDRMRVTMATIRLLSAGATLGAAAGVVGLGAGSRLAMRGIALAAGIPTNFSWEGTLGLTAMGGILGAALGTIYLSLRDRLPGGRWRALTFAFVLILLISATMIGAAGQGELALAPLWVSIPIFSALPLAYTLLLEVLCGRFLAAFPIPARERPFILFFSVVTALGGVGAVLLIVLSSIGLE